MPVKSPLTAAAVMTMLLGGTALADQATHERTLSGRDGHIDLSVWIYDSLKIERGLKPELDWSRPDAPDLRMIEEALAARPSLSGPEKTMEADDYVLHYTNDGADGVTDAIAQAAFDSIAFSWDKEVNQLGYLPPPDDGNRGGDGRYDFYFTQQRLTYGVTYRETQVDSNTYSSYIALGSWMNEAETQVTVAHEFFHAIHYTYDALEENWWFESTATWMEDQVYDDINDYYNYVPDTMDNPQDSLRSTSNMYANSIYVHSLTEGFNVDLVKAVWERCSLSDQSTALATNRAIVEAVPYRGDYDEVLHNFRESMVDTDRFEEGDAYGKVTPTATVTFPIFDKTGSITASGANIFRIPGNGGDPTTLDVTVAGTADLTASLLVHDRRGYTEIGPDSAGGASFSVDNFGDDWDEAYLVITNTSTGTGDASYTAHIEAPGWGGGSTGGCDTSGRGRGVALFGLLPFALMGLRLRRRS